MLSPSEQPEQITTKQGRLDYQKLTHHYPWILERGQNCILSPDSDGFLCGLFMSHYLDWKVKGFYDGKILVLEEGLSPKDCVFLDVEIFRREIRSIGQHMVSFRNDQLSPNWDNFSQSIQANNLRGFDFKSKFPQKYPFGTIHLLMSIVGTKIKINAVGKGISFLLYTDGTFKNLLGYPENSLSWFEFLSMDDSESAVYPVFFSEQNILSKIMLDLRDIFTKLASMNNGRRGADKLQLTKKKRGAEETEVVGVEEMDKGLWRVKPDLRTRNKKFLELLSSVTGWEYKESDWQYENLQLKRFTKESIKPAQGRYFELLEKNPISLAITSGQAIEYTLEGPDQLL